MQTNKDLDLPTQQELLAQFCCDEISAVALSEFNEQAKLQKQPVEAGKVVEGRCYDERLEDDCSVGSQFPFPQNISF